MIAYGTDIAISTYIVNKRNGINAEKNKII